MRGQGGFVAGAGRTRKSVPRLLFAEKGYQCSGTNDCKQTEPQMGGPVHLIAPTYHSIIMDSIRHRFLQAEEDFLSAAQLGDQALADFAERWQTLQSDWESCLHETDDSTRRLANGVASKIEVLAGDFFTFESRSISLEDDLLNGIEDALASLTLEDSVHLPTPSASKLSESPRSDPGAASPSEWLLHNLHNPYPLPHTQFSTGYLAGSKHIKDWFSKARQRIGWTRLLRDRFAGCRSLAIEAAFRAFVRDDPANPLDADLQTAFSAIKSHAELVYGEDSVASKSPPKRLRSISPTPSLTFSSSSEDTDDDRCPIPLPEYVLDRPLKREYSDSSCSPLPKRRRCVESSAMTPVYSPIFRMHQSPSPILRTRGNPPACPEITPVRPKKRRLSESDQDGSRPKRPRGVEGNRLHVTSDPLPVAASAWFDFGQSFQMPNPASTDPLEPSSFDLDFFNPPSLSPCVPFPTPGEFVRRWWATTALTSTFVATTDTISSVAGFPGSFEIPQLDLLQSELPSFDSDWSEFLNLDPDLSLFPPSPSLLSSSASTPPLADDAILSIPTPSSLFSPLETLPYLIDKGYQLQTLGEPIIQGQDFLLPPGEATGIPSASALLSIC